MKFNIKVLTLIGVLLISGCQKNTESPVVEVNSLKDGLIVLNRSKNYTLETEHASYGRVSYIFLENSIGVNMSKRPSGLQAYIKDSNGIYPLNYESGLKSGEYCLNSLGNKITDLYSGEVMSTMYNIETDYVNSISDSLTSISFSKKDYKMKLLTTLGFSSSVYLDVESMGATYINGSVNFVIKMTGNKNYTYRLTNVNKSKFSEVDTFLANGGMAKDLEASLGKARSLIRSNNFTRDIYDFSTESYSGIEVFTNKYFYSRMNNSESGSGAMVVNAKANEYHSNDMNGCYFFQAGGDLSDPENYTFGIASNTPIYPKANIVEYYHYPTYLKILDNMQFVNEGAYSSTGYTYTGTPYYFNNSKYVLDFVSNFSIDQAYDTSTYVPEAVGIDINIGASDSESSITFIYYFTYGSTYAMPIPLRSFGSSNYSVLDAIHYLYNQ